MPRHIIRWILAIVLYAVVIGIFYSRGYEFSGWQGQLALFAIVIILHSLLDLTLNYFKIGKV
jgi:hypothetical protein